MKITELDLRAEGKQYKSAGRVFKVKECGLLDVETDTYLEYLGIPLIELLEMEFEEVKKTKNPYFRVRSSKKYYFVGSCGCSETTTDYNHGIDHKLFNIANYFNDKEYAEYVAFKETLMRKLDKFAWEHNTKVINWCDSSEKYYIAFSNQYSELMIDWDFAYKSNNVYFTSREIAEMALEKFKDDLIKLYTWEFDFLGEHYDTNSY